MFARVSKTLQLRPPKITTGDVRVPQFDLFVEPNRFTSSQVFRATMKRFQTSARVESVDSVAERRHVSASGFNPRLYREVSTSCRAATNGNVTHVVAPRLNQQATGKAH